MTALEALVLLDQVRPGDMVVGKRLHPDVSAAYQRMMHAATGHSVAATFAVPSHDEIARQAGVPLYVQDTISGASLAQARAVLSAAVAGERGADWQAGEWPVRTRGWTPVNDKTVAEAVALAESVLRPVMAEAAQ